MRSLLSRLLRRDREDRAGRAATMPRLRWYS